MYAVEFETDIKSEYIKVPEYNKLKNKYAKILFLLNDNIGDLKEDRKTNPEQLFRKFLIKRDVNPITVPDNVDLSRIQISRLQYYNRDGQTQQSCRALY